MAAVTVTLNNGGIPAPLQLLLLQYLASTVNGTHITNSYNKDIINSNQSVTVTVDNDLFKNEDTKRLLDSVENKITKMIQDFKTALVEEHKKSSFKSQQPWTDILLNFTATSTRSQDMLQESTQENLKNSNKILEVQDKLLNLTQEDQKAWMQESSKIYNVDQEVQTVLSKMEKQNEKLEETIASMSKDITSSNEKIQRRLEKNQEFLLLLILRDTKNEELKEKVEEATQKNQQLSDALNKATAKYTKIQQAFGLTEQQQNYCRLPPTSILWKLTHKDPQVKNPTGAFIWTPTHSEIGAGKMQILYSSPRDVYIRGVGKEEIGGWDKGIYEHKTMFRMVENNYKVAYLARKVGTTEGTISWKFDLSASGTLVDNIKIRFSTSVFQGGKVDAQVCASSECISIPSENQVLEITDFQGVSQIVIRAKTTLGANAGWLQGQLFRQSLSDLTGYGFDVTINLKRCDVTVF